MLKSESGAGGLHENTFLTVMGDHGQTTNGDHGGGTAEEVQCISYTILKFREQLYACSPYTSFYFNLEFLAHLSIRFEHVLCRLKHHSLL